MLSSPLSIMQKAWRSRRSRALISWSHSYFYLSPIIPSFFKFFWLQTNSLAKALLQSTGKGPGPGGGAGTLCAALMPVVLPVGLTKGQQQGQPVLGAQRCRC